MKKIKGLGEPDIKKSWQRFIVLTAFCLLFISFTGGKAVRADEVDQQSNIVQIDNGSSKVNNSSKLAMKSDAASVNDNTGNIMSRNLGTEQGQLTATTASSTNGKNSISSDMETTDGHVNRNNNKTDGTESADHDSNIEVEDENSKQSNQQVSITVKRADESVAPPTVSADSENNTLIADNNQMDGSKAANNAKVSVTSTQSAVSNGSINASLLNFNAAKSISKQENGPGQHVLNEKTINKQMGLVVLYGSGKPLYSLPGSMPGAKGYGWTDNYRTVDGISAGQLSNENVNVVAEYQYNDITWALFVNSKHDAYWIDEQYLNGLIVSNGPAQRVAGEIQLNKVMYLKVVKNFGKPLYSLPRSFRSTQEFGWTDEYKAMDGRLMTSLPTGVVNVLAEYRDANTTWALFASINDSAYWIDEQFLESVQVEGGPAQHVIDESLISKTMGLVVLQGSGKPLYSLPGSMSDAKSYGWTDDYRNMNGVAAGQLASENVAVIAEYQCNNTTWALFMNSKHNAYWIDEQYLGGLIVSNGPAQHVVGEKQLNKMMYLKVIQYLGKPLYSLPGSFKNAQEFGWTDEYMTADGKLSVPLPTGVVNISAEYTDSGKTWVLFTILGANTYWIDEQFLEPNQVEGGPAEHAMGELQVNKTVGLVVLHGAGKPLYSLPGSMTDAKDYGWTDDYRTRDGISAGQLSTENVDIVAEYQYNDITWALFVNSKHGAYWIDEQYLGGLIVSNGPAQHVVGEEQLNKAMYLKVTQYFGKPLYSLPGSFKNTQEFGWTDACKAMDGRSMTSLPTEIVSELSEYNDGNTTWALFTITGNSAYWIDEQYLEPVQNNNGPGVVLVGANQVNKTAVLFVKRYEGHSLYTLPNSIKNSRLLGWTDNINGQLLTNGQIVNISEEFRDNTTLWALFSLQNGMSYWIDEQYLTIPHIYFNGVDARTYQFYAIKDMSNEGKLYNVASSNQSNTDAHVYNKAIVYSDMEVSAPDNISYTHISLDDTWYWIKTTNLSFEHSVNGQSTSPISVNNCYNMNGQIIYSGNTKYSFELDKAAKDLNAALGETVFVKYDTSVASSVITLNVIDVASTDTYYMSTYTGRGVTYVNTNVVGQGDCTDSMMIEKIYEHELCHVLGLNHTGERVNNEIATWSWSDDSDLMFSNSDTPTNTHVLTSEDIAALKLIRKLRMYYNTAHPNVSTLDLVSDDGSN